MEKRVDRASEGHDGAEDEKTGLEKEYSRTRWVARAYVYANRSSVESESKTRERKRRARRWWKQRVSMKRKSERQGGQRQNGSYGGIERDRPIDGCISKETGETRAWKEGKRGKRERKIDPQSPPTCRTRLPE